MTGLGVSSLQKIILIITGILLNCPGRPISDRILPIHQHHNATVTTVSQSRVVLIGKVDCVVVSEVTLSYQSTAHNWPPRSKYPMSGWDWWCGSQGVESRLQSLPRNYLNWKSLSLKLLFPPRGAFIRISTHGAGGDIMNMMKTTTKTCLCFDQHVFLHQPLVQWSS